VRGEDVDEVENWLELQTGAGCVYIRKGIALRPRQRWLNWYRVQTSDEAANVRGLAHSPEEGDEHDKSRISW